MEAPSRRKEAPIAREPRAESSAGVRADATARWRRLYRQPAVRRCLVEFLGGPSLSRATAQFLTRPRPTAGAPFGNRSTGELWRSLALDPELARSLWDREALVVDLDVDHVHFDRPSLPLADPGRSLALQQPVFEAIETLLAEAGIAPLRVRSGRGLHYLWCIARDSAAFASLVELGDLSPSLAEAYSQPRPPAGERVGERLGLAWSGLGKVLERFGHRVLELAAPRSAIPVQLTAVVAGPGAGGREVVSLDLSAFADPLHRRGVRMPFTAYFRPDASESAGRALRVPVPIPVGVRPSAGAPDPERAAELARTASCTIPDGSIGSEALIADYRRSPLARFHADFLAEPAEPPAGWLDAEREQRLADLPACVGAILRQPNDLLLRPACIQLVVRVLLAFGWKPRQIAAAIRAEYEQPHGWLKEFHFHDAGLRAETYTRLFAGLIAVGRDELVDFNCTSSREKGLCAGTNCGWNLAALGEGLLAEAVRG